MLAGDIAGDAVVVHIPVTRRVLRVPVSEARHERSSSLGAVVGDYGVPK
jgi:hypothetical protein